MPSQNQTTHTIRERKLIVYARKNVPYFQCRYKINDEWIKRTTGKTDLKEAINTAEALLLEAEIRHRNNLPVITRKFRNVAKLAIRRMEDELDANSGKVSYSDYIKVIEIYLIKYFKNSPISQIDNVEIEKFNQWRKIEMNKEPTRSTLLTHNAALNRVFDEAEIRGFITKSNRPVLKAIGRKSERRPAFDINEIAAVLAKFDDWIERARTEKSKELRQLLKDYVHVLNDTGARPGKELMNLKWKHLNFNEVKKLTLATKGDVDVLGKPIKQYLSQKYNFEITVTGKTGRRTFIANNDSIYALLRIIKRNYNLINYWDNPLKNLPANDDYVFRTKDKTKPTSFHKMFDGYLREHNLLIDPKTDNNRVLYSLRHTYATNKLLYDKVKIHTLAKQMGTSVLMIEKHYSHLQPIQAIEQLRGDATTELIKNTAVDEAYNSNADNAQ